MEMFRETWRFYALVIIVIAMSLGASQAQGQDVQYSRARNGQLNVQINPGAGAVGPFHNMIPYTTPGLSAQGSYGSGSTVTAPMSPAVPLVSGTPTPAQGEPLARPLTYGPTYIPVRPDGKLQGHYLKICVNLQDQYGHTMSRSCREEN